MSDKARSDARLPPVTVELAHEVRLCLACGVPADTLLKFLRLLREAEQDRRDGWAINRDLIGRPLK